MLNTTATWSNTQKENHRQLPDSLTWPTKHAIIPTELTRTYCWSIEIHTQLLSAHPEQRYTRDTAKQSSEHFSESRITLFPIFTPIFQQQLFQREDEVPFSSRYHTFRVAAHARPCTIKQTSWMDLKKPSQPCSLHASFFETVIQDQTLPTANWLQYQYCQYM